MSLNESSIKIDKNQNKLDPWDRATFIGRFKYFSWLTDPRNSLIKTEKLLQAKKTISDYKNGEEYATNLDSRTLLELKQLEESSFHPDSGELQNVFGRMSFQMPGNICLTGLMLFFYKSNLQVTVMQLLNQSYNSLVNYTNRNAQVEVSTKEVGLSYVAATSCAVSASLLFRNILLKKAPPVFQRFVPLAAVFTANFINIPLTRQKELRHGVALYTSDKVEVAKSKLAAAKGILQVCISRNMIALPPMLAIPIIMSYLEKSKRFPKNGVIPFVTQILLLAGILYVSVPFGCAIYPQICPINAKYAILNDERDLGKFKTLYFNKGL